MSCGPDFYRIVSSSTFDRSSQVTVMIRSEAPHSVDSTADRLTRVLFGADHQREHGPWRRFAGAEIFRRRPGASSVERLALAYERLRAVNDAIDSPADLAADPRAVAALHEWLAPVDPSFTTVAGIHYNLFLGSLFDHDHASRFEHAAAGRRPSGWGMSARGVCGHGVSGHGVSARGVERCGVEGCEVNGQGPGGRVTDRDLTDFLTLRRVGTFLCTEVAHGNDAVALETTATYDRARDGFLLHTPHAGAQKFMPNTGPVGGPKSGVVAARLLVDGVDHGVFMFLTPLTDGVLALPGVRVRPLSARFGSPVDHCVTSFDQVFLARDALLGGAHGRLGRLDEDGVFRSEESNRRRRFLASIGRVTAGKLAMSAGALGGARVALALAVRYGGHRLISGPRAVDQVPVFAHRSHHGPLAGALATVFAMTLLHRTVLDTWEAHTEANKGESERLVAVAKGWITWRAREIIMECRERCGAQGLLEHNGLTEMIANIEGAITAEGDNSAIYAKAAAELLFSARAPEPGLVWDALGTRGTRELSDAEFLNELLLEVEQLWAARARRRMGRTPQGDPLTRWNAASGAALRAVEAHAYRRAAEAYTAAVADLTERAEQEEREEREEQEEQEEQEVRELRRERENPAEREERGERAGRGERTGPVQWGEQGASAGPGGPTERPAGEHGLTALELLRVLHRLFALQWIDRNSGDLLAADRLLPRQLDELPEVIEQLIAELAAHAPVLVESFALPEAMLADWPISGAGYAEAYDDPDGPWQATAENASLSQPSRALQRFLRFFGPLRTLVP
jgi:acyl-CoA oxidase